MAGFWPPGKVCLFGNPRWIVDELSAAIGENGVDVGERFEATVCDGFVDERPQAFGGLQVWGVGRKKDQTQALGNREPGLAMPPGIVEGQNNAALFACADRLGEVGQQLSKNGLLTPSDRYRTVSPPVGCTKAVT